MAWLSDWAKRVKLTIDQGDITAALANFPVLLYLSASSGRGPDDISFIFDELTSNANRKKIAVTTSDGETECYVEIEKWDDAGEEAWLWIKVPVVAHDADTDLYLYYDSGQADNTAHVGDPSDAVVHNVWDSDFKLVSHMRDDPDNEHVRDSTVNAYDGTKQAVGGPAVVTGGPIDGAQDYDGSSDYITHGTGPNILGDITVEAWVETPASWDEQYAQIVARGGASKSGFNLYVWNATSPTDKKFSLILLIAGGAWGQSVAKGTTIALANTVYYAAGVRSGTNVKIYLDAVCEHTDSGNAGNIDYGASPKLYSGYKVSGLSTAHWKHLIDEVRISASARTPAWIEASYESGRDDLLDWGSEETPGGEDYPVSVSLSRTAGVVASASASAGGSTALSRSVGVSEGGQSATLASTSLARKGGIGSTALASALSAVVFSRSDGITSAASAEALASSLLEIFRGLSARTVLEEIASLTLDRFVGITGSAQAEAMSPLALARFVGIIGSAQAETISSVTLTRQLTVLFLTELIEKLGFIAVAEALLYAISVSDASVTDLAVSELGDTTD